MSELSLTPQEPSVALMLQGMLSGIQQGDITPQSVEVLKGMMDLYERNESRQAKKDFADALAALQAETGQIQAQTVVLNRDGTQRYKYAKLEHIMAKAQPLLAKHGFAHSFDTLSADGTLTAIFKLTHRSGHSESNQFTTRVSKGQGTNEAQDDMGAKSYAKRGAVCDGLGIVISSDDDARNLGNGQKISQEDAALLRERVEAIGANKTVFLQFAHAASFEEIKQIRHEELCEMLSRKEAAKSK